MKTKFYSLLLFGVIFLISYESVFACLCVYIENPSAEFVVGQHAKAVAVFSGEVIESDIVKVKFKIEKVWKGDVGDELEMSTGGKKINDDLYNLPSSCDYGFHKSEKYLVFAYGNDFDDMKATKCNLTNESKRAEKTEKILDDFFGSVKKNRKTKFNFSSKFSVYNLLAESFSSFKKSSPGLTNKFCSKRYCLS